MTRMLASVTGPEEASIALAGGADIIDLKDPAHGALGAVDRERVRDTVALIAGQKPVSAVTGHTVMEPATVRDAAEAMVSSGVDYLKQGIFPDGDAAGCIRALAPVAARTRLVAVLFADQDPDLSLLPLLAASGFAGAMLDTAEKTSGRLLECADLSALRRFVAACASQKLLSGLAGSLEAPDIPRLLLLGPGYLGFRGALCRPADRAGPINLDAVQQIRHLIPRETGEASDEDLVAGAFGADRLGPDPTSDPGLNDPGSTDIVFVHGLTLPVHIGAYAREVGPAQRVRFDVDVVVKRAAHPADDMRDVFSYDVISDGIRLLVEAGHAALVETLAERIAAMLLAHPRVVKARVKVAKLDTGPLAVGVVIERSRDHPVPGFGPP
jgi:dihydroneopterin aldolase